MNEEAKQAKLGKIKANLEQIRIIINVLTENNEILKNDNNYIQENVADLSYSIGPETSVNIIETLSGLRVNINTINEQLDSLINVVKIAETNYESRRKAYEEGSILFDEVGRAYNASKDGHTITSSGRKLNIDGETYYNYFSDKWIGERVASDMANKGSSELGNLMDHYNYVWEEAKSHSEGSASLGDSRDTYISNLQSAEADLQKYLSDNGFPTLVTKSSNNSSN